MDKSEIANYVLGIICVILLCVVIGTKSYSDGLQEILIRQSSTINQLRYNLDSAEFKLRLSVSNADSIRSGLDGAIKLAERSDSVITNLRTTISESGSSITQLINRQLRINGLAESLIQDHSRLKVQLAEIIRASNEFKQSGIPVDGAE